MAKADNHKVSSFAKLHERLSEFRDDHGWMFRGHRDAAWPLVPKAGRSPFFRANEELFFNAWKRRAIAHIPSGPRTDWDWLTVAQHHGLSTRLLDWSGNPMTGAYFAVLGETGTDAALYAFKPKFEAPVDKADSPYDVKPGIVNLRPSAFVARVSSQLSRFTLHNPPTSDLAGQTKYGPLNKIIVEARYVRELRIELDYYGYNAATIFPDLDGLSTHLNWIGSQQDLRRELLDQEKQSRP